MKTKPLTFLLALTFLFLIGVLNVKNVYAIDKCTTVEKNFNNQIDKIFRNIKSLETCIKPASKYRLKSCVKRKQEGSKGFNCLPELSKSLNSNKKNDCEVRFHDIKRSLQNLALLDEDNKICQKDVY
jgi:hypothetical protein